MSQKANHFKIGAFVLAGTAVLVAGLIIYGAGQVFHKGVMMETYVDQSVQGLDVGSPVKFRGVQVGSVSEITFVQEEYHEASSEYGTYVLVRAELQKNFLGTRDMGALRSILRDHIDRGMRVRVTSQGLTGLSYLEVDYLEPGRYEPLETDWEPDNLYVPSAPSLITQVGESLEKVAIGLENANIELIAQKIDRLIESVTQSVEDAELMKLSQQAVSFIDESRETNRRIRELLNNPQLDTIPAGINKSVNHINQILEKNEEDIILLVEELRETSQELRTVGRRFNQATEGEKLSAGIDNFSAAAANARQVTEKANALSDDLPRTLHSLDRSLDRLGMLLATQQGDLQEIVENIKAVSQNLREMTENTREYPSLLFFGEPPQPRKESEE